MTDAPQPLRIQLDGDAPPLAGFLQVNGRADADVPLALADGLPFTDRSVAVVDGGKWVGSLELPDAIALLLECRRVLRPGGILRLAVPGDASAAAAPDLRQLAARVGLDAVNPAGPGGAGPAAATVASAGTGRPAATLVEFTKPDRRVTGDPLVSILIPAYSPRFFAACLDSAVAQTYANLEIVVCDDSEGPEIEAIARRAGARREVRYQRNPKRLGGRGNYIRCFDAARGELVKFLNDDDLLAPRCVEALLDAFRRQPDVTLATSRRQRIDELGQPLPDQPATLPIVGADAVIAGFTLANAMLMPGINVVGEPTTTLYRRADLVAQKPDYFGFGGAAGTGVIDVATWSTLLLMGDAVYLTACQSSFRIHPGQRQNAPEIRDKAISGMRGLQEAWLRLGLHARQPHDHLLVKPFPSSEDEDWQLRRVLSFAPPAPPRAPANPWNPAWPGGYAGSRRA